MSVENKILVLYTTTGGYQFLNSAAAELLFKGLGISADAGETNTISVTESIDFPGYLYFETAGDNANGSPLRAENIYVPNDEFDELTGDVSLAAFAKELDTTIAALPTTEYVDSAIEAAAVSAGSLKEQILVVEQLSNDYGILPAIVINPSGTIADGDTFFIENSETFLTFTFKAAPDGDFDVQVGSGSDESLENLVGVINEFGTNYSAVYIPEQLGVDPRVVIYESSSGFSGENTSRVYGVFADAGAVHQVNFSERLEYGNYSTEAIPTEDPGSRTFGFRRVKGELADGEIHSVLVGNSLMHWDAAGSGSWFTLNGEVIPFGTAASGGGVKGKLAADSDKGLAIDDGVLEVKIDGLTTEFDEDGELGVKYFSDHFAVTEDGLVLSEGIVESINSGGALIEYFNNTEGTIADRAIVMTGAFGTIEPALASTVALDTYNIGIAAEAIPTEDTGNVYMKPGTIVDGFSDLTPGLKVFVSADTAGAVTQDISDFETGDHIYRIGRAIDATRLAYDPEHEGMVADTFI